MWAVIRTIYVVTPAAVLAVLDQIDGLYAIQNSSVAPGRKAGHPKTGHEELPVECLSYRP